MRAREWSPSKGGSKLGLRAGRFPGMGHLSVNVRRTARKYLLLSQAQEEKSGRNLYRPERVRTNGG